MVAYDATTVKVERCVLLHCLRSVFLRSNDATSFTGRSITLQILRVLMTIVFSGKLKFMSVMEEVSFGHETTVHLHSSLSILRTAFTTPQSSTLASRDVILYTNTHHPFPLPSFAYLA